MLGLAVTSQVRGRFTSSPCLSASSALSAVSTAFSRFSFKFQARLVWRDSVEAIAAADHFRFTTTDVVMSMNRKPEVGLSTDFTDLTDGLEQDGPPHRCFRVSRGVKRQSLSTGSQSV
jgi:hypothetical protein